MELKELALRTREEIEQELDKICKLPENPENADEVDRALEKRVEIRKSILRLQVEALFDGKLTIDQVVALQHMGNAEKDVDVLRRKCLEGTLDKLKEGKNRENILDETVNYLNLL